MRTLISILSLLLLISCSTFKFLHSSGGEIKRVWGDHAGLNVYYYGRQQAINAGFKDVMTDSTEAVVKLSTLEWEKDGLKSDISKFKVVNCKDTVRLQSVEQFEFSNKYEEERYILSGSDTEKIWLYTINEPLPDSIWLVIWQDLKTTKMTNNNYTYKQLVKVSNLDRRGQRGLPTF